MTIPRTEAEEDAAFAAVPCLAALIDMVLRLLPFDPGAPMNILDLGGGSGVLAAAILDRFRGSHVTLLEESAPLRVAAEKRLSSSAPGRYKLVPEAFERTEMPRGFDAVVSLLRLHAVDEIARRAVYRSIYGALLPNCMVLIADRLRAGGPGVAAIHQRVNPPPAGVELGRGLLLSNELPWLVSIGFRDVDIHYKNIDYGVYGGRRPAAADFHFGEGSDEDEPRRRR